MKILLAGGSGFIGKNIHEQLGKKYTFFSPSHQQLDFLDADSVENFLRKNTVDLVIYAVNIGGIRKMKSFPNVLYTNLRCFFNVVRCRRYFKKMIFFGSGAEYDKRYPIAKLDENDFGKRVPVDDYGFYKYVCSEYIKNDDDIINLRLFGVYGKYEDYTLRFISNAICRNLFDLPITISQNAYFDYIYVDDLIRIVDHFIVNRSRHNVYNIGRGRRIDLLTIAKTINKVVLKPSQIIIHKQGLQNEYTCDNSRLMREIKDLNFTDFKTSVAKLYFWYKSLKPRFNKNSLMVDRQ